MNHLQKFLMLALSTVCTKVFSHCLLILQPIYSVVTFWLFWIFFLLLFTLDTDAYHTKIGAVLSQLQDNRKVVIAYFSKSSSMPEQNYNVTYKELLAAIKSCEHFKHYLISEPFTIRKDHGSLMW